MATTTKTVFLTDENGNLLVDSNGRPRALTFTVIEGKSLRLAERETIPTVTYAELKTYSESVQTYTGITNTAKFSVEDVAVFQYIVSDRGNTRAYITAQVSAVNDTSLTANGIGISVAGADGKNGNDGATPEIGENGNWYINGEDTGKSSKGAKGDDGKSVTSATAGTVSEADGYTVTPVTFGLSDGSSLPAIPIKAKNAEVEIIDLGEQVVGTTFPITSEQLEKMKSNNPPLVKVRLTKVFSDSTYNFTLSRLALYSDAAYYGGAFATDDKAFAVGMDAHGTSAFFEVREIPESGGLQVQAFEYGQNSNLSNLYNVLAGLAGQSKKIIAVEFESFNSLPNVKFTVNNVEYEGFVASITPSNDGYFTVSGQAFAPEAISTAYSLFLINVGAGKIQFVPFVQGLSFNDTAPIDVVWGASGTLYVYYQ